MNEPIYKISGTERRKQKKALCALKEFKKFYWWNLDDITEEDFVNETFDIKQETKNKLKIKYNNLLKTIIDLEKNLAETWKLKRIILTEKTNNI